MGEPIPSIHNVVFPRDLPFEKEERVVSVFCDSREFTWALHEGPSKDHVPITMWK
jgi:hypothetical protein